MSDLGLFVGQYEQAKPHTLQVHVCTNASGKTLEAMATDRLFTNANDAQLAELIHRAKSRLVFAAPGISKKVATALSAKIGELGQQANITVVLDPDPEVCRLGYGDLEGLQQVDQALKQVNLRLKVSEGLRIGLVIADEETLVFSPTPLLVEAETDSPTKPNAIFIQKATPDAFEAACGARARDENRTTLEIGACELSDEQLKRTQENLARNPPKQFDLARIERVFNYELEFVEFKVENFSLGRRAIPLKPSWLGLNDKELQSRFRNTFRLFEAGEGVPIHLDALDPDGNPRPGETLEVTEKYLAQEAQKLRKELIPLGDHGNAILKRKREEFERRVDVFKNLIFRYAAKAREGLVEEIAETKIRLMEDLMPALVRNPPKEWKAKSVTAELDETRIRELLSEELDKVLRGVSSQFAPKVTLIFKGVTYATIVSDPSFRERLEVYFGPSEAAKLFHEHLAAPERGLNSGNPSTPRRD